MLGFPTRGAAIAFLMSIARVGAMTEQTMELYALH